MMDFLRKLFSRCHHKWEFTKMVNVNKYGDEENDEILSSKEYSLQKCVHCRKMKFRKL